MKLSNHAKKRSRQRGITNRQVELILKHGKIKDKCGAYECFIPKDILSEIISDYKKRIQDLENISKANKTLILNEETVITVYNRL